VRLEIERRRGAGTRDDADVVVAIRELGELEADAMATAATVGSHTRRNSRGTRAP
jgi:hypothetical protein